MAPPARFELATFRLVACRSILSELRGPLGGRGGTRTRIFGLVANHLSVTPITSRMLCPLKLPGPKNKKPFNLWAACTQNAYTRLTVERLFCTVKPIPLSFRPKELGIRAVRASNLHGLLILARILLFQNN